MEFFGDDGKNVNVYPSLAIVEVGLALLVLDLHLHGDLEALHPAGLTLVQSRQGNLNIDLFRIRFHKKKSFYVNMYFAPLKSRRVG